MNILEGKITAINGEPSLSIVKVLVHGHTFSSVVLDSPDTVAYLREGNCVKLLFKETEVVLGVPGEFRISLQNKLLCRIKKIHRGKILSRVELDFNESHLESIVTLRAIQDLELEEGQEVIAMIKTNEVMLKSC